MGIYFLIDLLCSNWTILEILIHLFLIPWYRQKIINPEQFHYQILNQKTLKSMLIKKSKAVTVTANETNQSSNNGCEYSSSSSCSYKFQLPERVIFDSLKSELEGANLSMKWEVDEEEDKNEENNKKQTVPIEIVEE